jgi:hypothetical protein
MNPLVVTMTTYNRPSYLAQVITGLNSNADFGKYDLVASVEPGCDTNLAVLAGAKCRDKHIHVNHDVLGHNDNTYRALDLGFQLSNFVILIEDDIVPGPDALDYFQHCREAYKGDPSVFTVAGCSNRPPEDLGRECDHKIGKRPWFACWGWATWQSRWEEIKETWSEDTHDGWDGHIANVVRGDRVEVYPLLSRVQNIGAVGGHVPSPEWHVANHHFQHWSGNTQVLPGEWEEVAQ